VPLPRVDDRAGAEAPSHRIGGALATGDGPGAPLGEGPRGHRPARGGAATSPALSRRPPTDRRGSRRPPFAARRLPPRAGVGPGPGVRFASRSAVLVTVLGVMGCLAVILSVVALRTPVAGGAEQEALGALVDFATRTRGLAEADRQREELAVCSTLLAMVEGLTGSLDEEVLWRRLLSESRRILETDWAIALRAEDAGMLVV